MTARKLVGTSLLLVLAGGFGCKKKQPDVIAQHYEDIVALAKDAGAQCDQVLAQPECREPVVGDVEGRAQMPPMPSTPLASAPGVREILVICTEKGRRRQTGDKLCNLRPKAEKLTVDWACPKVVPLEGTPKIMGDDSGELFGNVSGPDCKEDLYRVVLRRPTSGGNSVQVTVHLHKVARPPAS
jgi:hypothetical protein